MKKTLERIVQKVKNIKRKPRTLPFRGARLGLTLLALATPFILTNKAKASEGWILVDYMINAPYTNSNWSLTHHPNAKEGIDSHDNVYFPMFNSSGIASKITSTVEGKEIETDVRPEFSTSSANFTYTVITKNGSPVPQINNPYFVVSTNGFEEEDVSITVEGVTYDARTVGTIPLTNLTGTGTVNFSKPSEPNTTNPNEVERVSGTLRIDNVHEKIKGTTFKLIYSNGATENPNDSMDVEYTRWTGIPPPFIVSKVGDKYLKTDSRRTDSKTLVYLQQMFHSDSGYANIFGGDTNVLVFSFPEENINSPTNEKFGDRVITFQEYIPDANDPNYPKVADPNAETYPVYLIRDMIEEDPNGMGVVLLPSLARKVYAGTWHNFILRTDIPTRELAMADFNEDGIVDVNDRLMLEGYLGYEGTSRYDIASLKDPLAEPNTPNYGLISIGTTPDYIVDSTDKTAFEEMMIADEKRRGVYDPNSE